MTQAWIILAWKARPTHTPATRSEARRPVAMALVVAPAGSTSKKEEKGVVDFPAVEQDRDRSGRQDDGSRQPCHWSRDPSQCPVDDEHREGALDHLGQHERPHVKA